MTVPEPIAQGDLASKPFAHLLLYLEQRALAGTLAIWPPQAPPTEGSISQQGQDRVLFVDGRPTAARWRTPNTVFEKGILELFGRANGPYAFYPTDLVGSGPGVVNGRADSHVLLAASVKAGIVRDDAVEAVLRRFGTTKVRLKLGVDLSRFRFDSKADAFLEVLRAMPGSTDDLARISGNPQLARRLLYVLAITNSVEPYDGSAQPLKSLSGVMLSPMGSGTAGRAQGLSSSSSSGLLRTPSSGRSPSSSGRAPAPRSQSPARSMSPPRGTPMQSAPPPEKFDSPPSPPSGLSAELRERWRQIADRAVNIEKQNYFVMLGVSTDANMNQVTDAYLRLAKDWHPDRIPLELHALKPWVDRIFHHLTQAKDTLANDEHRTEHAKAIQHGGGTPESERQVNAIVYAAMEYQKVEVLVRRREWDEALAILMQAQKSNPDEADYYAMEAMILYSRHQGKSAPYPKMIAAADMALQIREDHERANFYKGLILKRMGEESKAYKYFKKAVEANPRNIEAAREVRLAKLRGTSIPPGKRDKDAGGDLFSKFFKKK